MHPDNQAGHHHVGQENSGQVHCRDARPLIGVRGRPAATPRQTRPGPTAAARAVSGGGAARTTLTLSARAAHGSFNACPANLEVGGVLLPCARRQPEPQPGQAQLGRLRRRLRHS
eukprot:scaffold10022_cov79-Isochrysis_galbana.AAC.2